MSTDWTHPICDDCWELRVRPIEKKNPIRMTDKFRELTNCCWCGRITRSGIYYRADPMLIPSHVLEGRTHE